MVFDARIGSWSRLVSESSTVADVVAVAAAVAVLLAPRNLLTMEF